MPKTEPKPKKTKMYVLRGGSERDEKVGPEAPKEIKKLRKCLKCLKMFESWGVGNRLCEACTKKAQAELYGTVAQQDDL